jgi:hypothetical protein
MQLDERCKRLLKEGHNCANCAKHRCNMAGPNEWAICLLYLGTELRTEKEAQKKVCPDWERI